MTICLNRRKFIASTAALAAASSLPMPAWARGKALAHAKNGFGELSGEDIELSIGDAHFTTGSRSGHAFAVNGTVPGPLIRLREGQDIRLHVTNNLDEDSSIHWHGLLLPF
ncbi:multicopper oxidase domain-containing protein, partial [Erythrobacter sp.]|uniref:multicopper oxidase domain-containing protein n=1 Tax=Erythrobacter sp. TaxID=1042 RepID=UPI002EA4B34F|nr:multicopper oxidase domain-containing protein [Erythrobacter sp.]